MFKKFLTWLGVPESKVPPISRDLRLARCHALLDEAAAEPGLARRRWLLDRAGAVATGLEPGADGQPVARLLRVLGQDRLKASRHDQNPPATLVEAAALIREAIIQLEGLEEAAWL